MWIIKKKSELQISCELVDFKMNKCSELVIFTCDQRCELDFCAILKRLIIRHRTRGVYVTGIAISGFTCIFANRTGMCEIFTFSYVLYTFV